MSKWAVFSVFSALSMFAGCSLDLGGAVDKIDEELDEQQKDGGKGGNDRGDNDPAGDRDRDEGGRDEDDRDEGDRGEDEGGGGDPQTDEDCALGVDAFCVCSGDYYGYACSDSDWALYYDMCVNGDDDGIFTCLADFVDDYYIVCYDAFDACL